MNKGNSKAINWSEEEDDIIWHAYMAISENRELGTSQSREKLVQLKKRELQLKKQELRLKEQELQQQKRQSNDAYFANPNHRNHPQREEYNKHRMEVVVNEARCEATELKNIE